MSEKKTEVAPSAGTGAEVTDDTGHPHRKAIFAICVAVFFMSTIDSTIVATALPRIGNSLHAPLNWIGWTITIYSLGTLIGLPLGGRLSDTFGRKYVFLTCLLIFVGSSIACGLANDIYMLVAFRLIQAIGGGAFAPSCFGLVTDYFGRDRDRAIGMFASTVPVGSIVGPVVGGFITQYWSWRGIFLINVPIGLVIFMFAVHFVPRSEPRPARHLDVAGIVLLFGSLISGMLAITLLGERNMSPTNFRVLLPAVAAIVFGWRLIRHTHRVEEPFIPLRLIRGKGFLSLNILNLLFGALIFGTSALLPLYAENRYGIPISRAGTMLSARAIGGILVAASATMLLRRTGYRLPMMIACVSIAIGFVGLGISPIGVPAYWWLAGWAMLTGLGTGWSAPATMNASLQLAPDQVGAISGVRGMCRQVGSISYVSIVTALLARSAHPGAVQAHALLVLAVVAIGMIGLIYRIPEHKGSW